MSARYGRFSCRSMRSSWTRQPCERQDEYTRIAENSLCLGIEFRSHKDTEILQRQRHAAERRLLHERALKYAKTESGEVESGGDESCCGDSR